MLNVLSKIMVAGSTTTTTASPTAKRVLLFALLGASFVLQGVVGAPLSPDVQAHGVVPNRGCATSVSELDRWEMEEGLMRARDAMSVFDGEMLESRDASKAKAKGQQGQTRPLKEVKFDVYFHVVYANESYEGGYVPDEQITQQIAVLNRDYASTNISYNLVNVTRIENADWFVNVWPGSPQEAEMKPAYHKGTSSVLNIFTTGFNATDRSLGYASLPSSYLREPLKDGLLIRYTTLPGGSHTNYNQGRTMVHELGHWLGLYHTFEGGCTGVGDNVADTAPESSGAEGCPVGRKSCPQSKEVDPIHNFMDYSFDSCMTHFTPGQAVRMHEAIWAFRTPRPPVASTTVPTPASSSASASSTAANSATSTAPASATSSETPEPEAGEGEDNSNEPKEGDESVMEDDPSGEEEDISSQDEPEDSQ